jgi:DNA-binding NarL/FixJ family response regulator
MLPSMPGKQGGTQATVALLSRHHLLRVGMQQLMQSEDWIRFLPQTAPGTNSDEVILQQNPDVIIIDSEITSDLPGLIHRIKAPQPAIKIILLCNMNEAERLRQTVGLGIDGLVLKMQPPQVLIATIKHLMNIPLYTTPPAGISTRNLRTIKAPGAIVLTSGQSREGDKSVLTERERQIVQLVTKGLSNKEIAASLYIADSTVRHHLTRIFDKLGISNRQKLLARARRHGID